MNSRSNRILVLALLALVWGRGAYAEVSLGKTAVQIEGRPSVVITSWWDGEKTWLDAAQIASALGCNYRRTGDLEVEIGGVKMFSTHLTQFPRVKLVSARALGPELGWIVGDVTDGKRVFFGRSLAKTLVEVQGRPAVRIDSWWDGKETWLDAQQTAKALGREYQQKGIMVHVGGIQFYPLPLSIFPNRKLVSAQELGPKLGWVVKDHAGGKRVVFRR